jgi:hypothetical protein
MTIMMTIVLEACSLLPHPLSLRELHSYMKLNHANVTKQPTRTATVGTATCHMDVNQHMIVLLAGIHSSASQHALLPLLGPTQHQQARRKLLQGANGFINGQVCEWCNQLPSLPNERIPPEALVGCNNSYCVDDISKVPCMDDPGNGCVCSATNNSCGVMPVNAAMQLERILLMQGGYFPRLPANDNTTRFTRHNLLPRQLLAYVHMLLRVPDGDDQLPTDVFDYLPTGFGCPDSPLVQQSLNSSLEQQILAMDSLLFDRVYDTIEPEDGVMAKVTCWVDARVTVNLLTMAILQSSWPCQDMAPTETCRNVTIFWQPPNSPCTETDADARATQCANITYHFMIPDRIICDDETMQMHNTTGRAVTVTSETGNITCYTSGTWGWDMDIFKTGGPLAADALSTAAAPAYPVPFNHNTSISPYWFAAPMDAYVISDYWMTYDLPLEPGQDQTLGWCLPETTSCGVLQQQQEQPQGQQQQQQASPMPSPTARHASGDEQSPGDMMSPPMECYVGRSTTTADNLVYTTNIYDWHPLPQRVQPYMPSQTATGEDFVCAAYRMRARGSEEWVWHYEVMAATTCANVAAAAATGNNVTAGYPSNVTCCTAPYCNKPGELPNAVCHSRGCVDLCSGCKIHALQVTAAVQSAHIITLRTN